MRSDDVESMNVSEPEVNRLALSDSRSSTSRVLGAATGSDNQQICVAADSGMSSGSGIGLSPGTSNAVPSGMTPAARRRENLLCWARSRSISRYEKPHG